MDRLVSERSIIARSSPLTLSRSYTGSSDREIELGAEVIPDLVLALRMQVFTSPAVLRAVAAFLSPQATVTWLTWSAM